MPGPPKIIIEVCHIRLIENCHLSGAFYKYPNLGQGLVKSGANVKLLRASLGVKHSSNSNWVQYDQ